MEPELEKITSEIIIRNFELEEIPSGENLLREMREHLILKLNFLLDHNFEKLISILYRIDVSEKKAKQAFSLEPEKISGHLADLIIERQMEKAKTRMEYRNGNRDDQ